MKWIIHYDVVAFILILIILVVYSSYNHLNTFPNRTYKILLSVSLASVVTDIASAVAGSYFGSNFIVLNYIIHLAHFVVQNLVPAIYCLFAYSLVHETGKMSKKWFCIIFVPYIFIFFMILSTPFTRAAFYIDSTGEYYRGKGQVLTYTVAAYYVICSCVIVLKNMKVLSRPQRLSVLLYSVECLVLTVIQLFYGKLLLQEIGIAFAMFFIYITMQNPLEYIDVQTGVYNRNLFKKSVNSKISKKEEFSIICVQVEGLSYINEKFGINNGNVLIKQIASFLLSFGKSYSVYRIGNRRFAIVMSKKNEFNYICNHIIDRFYKPFNFNNINVYVNLWMYMCCLQSSKNIHSMNDILDIIDYSLNEAKLNKKNSVVFASTDILEKRRRENIISQAITNAINKRSLKVFYQPIYSIKENKYTNMEALVRLIDDDVGFIPPDEFIPIAEKNGDILAIGEIVLEKVCSFIEQYHPEDYGINAIHVNLSVVQCMQENISIRLMNIIDKYKIPYGLIDFEITETTADNTSEKLEKIMVDFNKKGIHFSLDDYGTGYSNQSNLMQYPYSVVKIDKSMVWACDSNPKASISLKHTIAMIKDLEMNVLAEGVETDQQNDFLKSVGCEYLQGYYYSRPISEKECIDVIKNNKIKGEILN